MKIYTLDEAQDELLGPIGTPGRNRFERELQNSLPSPKVSGPGEPLIPIAIGTDEYRLVAAENEELMNDFMHVDLEGWEDE